MTDTSTPPSPKAEYCKPCDEYVLPIDEDCPLCGTEVGIPDSETIPADEDDSR